MATNFKVQVNIMSKECTIDACSNSKEGYIKVLLSNYTHFHCELLNMGKKHQQSTKHLWKYIEPMLRVPILSNVTRYLLYLVYNIPWYIIARCCQQCNLMKSLKWNFFYKPSYVLINLFFKLLKSYQYNAHIGSLNLLDFIKHF